MLAARAQALELSIVFSQSLARRRHRPSQASVRSTTHLRGNTSNPLAVSDRLMISMVETIRNFVCGLGMLGGKEPNHAETQRASYS